MSTLFISQPKPVGTVGRMWADNIPSYWHDSVSDMFALSTRALCKEPESFIHRVKASSSWHEMGRNQLAEETLGAWLLSLDTDHMFAPDILLRLLYLAEKHHLDVVSAVYQYKFPPHAPVAGDWVERADGRFHVNQLTSLDLSQEIRPVGVVGAGCLLVKRRVFNKIEHEFHEKPFSIIQGLSEDYSFCLRCKRLDIQIGLAPQVECHHVIPTVLSLQDHLRKDPEPLDKPAEV